MLYDPKQRMPACVLLQAAYGVATDSRILRNWDEWLTYPTEDMRVLNGTREQFERLAELDNALRREKK